MPFLNEDVEPIETIKSIYATSPSDLFNIIAIDDHSDRPLDAVKFKPFKDVTYLVNSERLGVDGSRQKGAEMSETPFIFIIDAHMRFKNDQWMEKIIECLEREPETAWCTVCLGLGYGTMDLANHKGKYYGADMLFVDENATPNRPSREVLEPKWKPQQQGLEYEIPCILGANYGFSTKWFKHIRGLSGLQMWGTSEPFLSIKTWMAGGNCKIRTDIQIGHKFRSNAPYVTKINKLVYNKIFMCKTIFPEDLSDSLISCLTKDVNFEYAMKDIQSNKKVIEEHRQYYKTIFKRSIYDYCDYFGIKLPEAIKGKHGDI